MQLIYGYCRISTKKQNIERQVRNILAAYPTAKIVKETYTGTRICRKGLESILKKVKPGDTIVFDSVSRMSRNADEGVALYMDLYQKRCGTCVSQRANDQHCKLQASTKQCYRIRGK